MLPFVISDATFTTTQV